jgi:flagellar basal-body rod protein FlgB
MGTNIAAFRQDSAAAPWQFPCNSAIPAIGTGFAEPSHHQMEFAMPGSLFGIHAAALELRSQRMGLLASNIANAGTPGYKARDLDFAAALKASQAGGDAGKAAEAATQYRVPTMSSLDGNTVELATEQLAFGENAVGYSATLSFIRGRVETVTRALKGE